PHTCSSRSVRVGFLHPTDRGFQSVFRTSLFSSLVGVDRWNGRRVPGSLNQVLTAHQPFHLPFSILRLSFNIASLRAVPIMANDKRNREKGKGDRRMPFTDAQLSRNRPASVRDIELPRRERYHPSPADWRDETLYFLLPDRFSDGQEQSRPLLDRRN